jgi:hypothetical protein
MTFREFGTHSGCDDAKVGKPFQADVRLENLTYAAYRTIGSSIPGRRVSRNSARPFSRRRRAVII